MKKYVTSFAILALSLLTSAAVAATLCKVPRVIYITMDGTAPYEVTAEHFPFMFSSLVPKAELLGTNGDKRHMQVASIPLSFPSYLSQMTGVVGPCESNECPRTEIETLPEEIKRRLGLTKYDVATFASWEPIQRAVEHETGAIIADTGENGHTRDDESTFLIGHAYLKDKMPRFFWLSLDASDHYAHANDRENFLRTLGDYDRYLKAITTTVTHNDCMKDDTWFVVTTDHGRGQGDDWTHHGKAYPFSKHTWLLVFHSTALLSGNKKPVPYDLSGSEYSTTDLRPMMKAMLGLE